MSVGQVAGSTNVRYKGLEFETHTCTLHKLVEKFEWSNKNHHKCSHRYSGVSS